MKTEENMNIEFIEFYPLECNADKSFLTGTLRVKLANLGFEILGINVSKYNDSYRFTLPGRKSINSQSGETVWYPFIVFEDKEKQSKLIDSLRKQGPVFIEKRLADTENPIVLPQRKIDQRMLEKFSHQKAKDVLSESQNIKGNTEVAPPSQKAVSEPPKQEFQTKSKPVKTMKTFQDVPARKTTPVKKTAKKNGKGEKK